MVERKCPTCNQPTVVNVGMNSENFQKLFRWPTFQEWMLLFMLSMLLVMAGFYKMETQICRDTITELDERGLLDQVYSEHWVPSPDIIMDDIYENPNFTNQEEVQR